MKRKGHFLLISYLILLVSTAQMSTDIYLPSMPALKNIFEISDLSIQLTMLFFFIGFILGQFFWGPFSDVYGRKSAAFIGISIFIVSSAVSALSGNIDMLIMARFFQGLGISCSNPLGFAMVTDSFEEKKTSKIIAIITAFIMISPMVAPILGGYILLYFNWKVIFIFLSFIGLLLFLFTIKINETNPKENRKPILFSNLMEEYWSQLKYKPFLISVISISASFSIIFSFITYSPILYIDHFKLTPVSFSYLFACNALFLVAGNITVMLMGHRLLDYYKALIGLAICIFGLLMMVGTLLLVPQSIYSVVVPVFFISYSIGIILPSLMGQALSHTVKYFGLTSALIGGFQFLGAGATSYLMGLLSNYASFGLLLGIGMMALILVLSLWFYSTTGCLKQIVDKKSKEFVEPVPINTKLK